MKTRIKCFLKSFFLDFRRTLFQLRMERARRSSERLQKNPLHWKAGEVLLIREMMKSKPLDKEGFEKFCNNSLDTERIGKEFSKIQKIINDSLPTVEEIHERFRRLSYPPPSPDSFPPKPPFKEMKVIQALCILERISPRSKEQEDLLREIGNYKEDLEAEIHFTFPFPDPPEGIFLDSIRIRRDGKTFVFIGEEQR